MPVLGHKVDNYLATTGTKGSSFSFSPLRGSKNAERRYTKSYEKTKRKLQVIQLIFSPYIKYRIGAIHSLLQPTQESE